MGWSYFLWPDGLESCVSKAPATTDLITQKHQMEVVYLHVYEHPQMDSFAFIMKKLLQKLVFK